MVYSDNEITVIEGNEVLIRATTWMNPENI